MAKGNRGRKERAEARRRRGYGDDLFYTQVQRYSVNPGDIIKVTVGETDAEGVGIVRIGLLTIRIPGSKIGEKVKIRVGKIRGRNALGELLAFDN